MYNHCVLMGRIVNDLELKTTPSGAEVLSFRIAVDRKYQADKENRVSDFFNIVAWRNTAVFISRYFAKGRMILVDGELQTRQYDDKNGNKVNVTELIVDGAHFTGEKKQESNNANGQQNNNNKYTPVQAPPPVAEMSDEGEDDDYPF